MMMCWHIENEKFELLGHVETPWHLENAKLDISGHAATPWCVKNENLRCLPDTKNH
jgi:hypothetical protein